MNLFSKTPALPTPPTPIAPPAMPDPLDPANVAASFRARVMGAQGGRASTSLTSAPFNAASTLAGAAYSGTKLGTA